MSHRPDFSEWNPATTITVVCLGLTVLVLFVMLIHQIVWKTLCEV